MGDYLVEVTIIFSLLLVEVTTIFSSDLVEVTIVFPSDLVEVTTIVIFCGRLKYHIDLITERLTCTSVRLS
jgi:hypothetical protein